MCMCIFVHMLYMYILILLMVYQYQICASCLPNKIKIVIKGQGNAAPRAYEASAYIQRETGQSLFRFAPASSGLLILLHQHIKGTM